MNLTIQPHNTQNFGMSAIYSPKAITKIQAKATQSEAGLQVANAAKDLSDSQEENDVADIHVKPGFFANLVFKIKNRKTGKTLEKIVQRGTKTDAFDKANEAANRAAIAISKTSELTTKKPSKNTAGNYNPQETREQEDLQEANPDRYYEQEEIQSEGQQANDSFTEEEENSNGSDFLSPASDDETGEIVFNPQEYGLSEDSENPFTSFEQPFFATYEEDLPINEEESDD